MFFYENLEIFEEKLEKNKKYKEKFDKIREKQKEEKIQKSIQENLEIERKKSTSIYKCFESYIETLREEQVTIIPAFIKFDNNFEIVDYVSKSQIEQPNDEYIIDDTKLVDFEYSLNILKIPNAQNLDIFCTIENNNEMLKFVHQKDKPFNNISNWYLL